jgi:trehalose/maltose transport system permease protein
MENGESLTTTRENRWIYCLPALLILVLVIFYPLFQTFYLSFTDARLTTLDHPKWLGFENYQYLFQSPDWWVAVWNTLLFTFVSLLFETGFGLIIAKMISTRLKGIALLRTAVLIPWTIPAVVAARIWAWMFNDLFGIINEILMRFHLIDERIAWLADSRLTLLTLVIVDVWKTTPFMCLLILAALQSIPKVIYEAAELDGASEFRVFFSITLPMIRPALLVAIMFRTLDALRVFDLPYILTSSSKSTAVLSTYVRQQLVDFQEVGFGSAASIVVFTLIATLAFIYLILNKKNLGIET